MIQTHLLLEYIILPVFIKIVGDTISIDNYVYEIKEILLDGENFRYILKYKQ
jgi:hypothetical protein